jgi:hypothetical protein
MHSAMSFICLITYHIKCTIVAKQAMREKEGVDQPLPPVLCGCLVRIPRGRGAVLTRKQLLCCFPKLTLKRNNTN